MILEVLKFTFSSFWVFCGSIILIYSVGLSVSTIISSFFRGGSYSLVNISKEDKPDKEKQNRLT